MTGRPLDAWPLEPFPCVPFPFPCVASTSSEPPCDDMTAAVIATDGAGRERWRHEIDGPGMDRLYYIAADPGETRDLSAEHPDRNPEPWEPTIREILGFLHVPPMSLPQSRAKQEQRPLREVIVNYEQIVSIRVGSLSLRD